MLIACFVEHESCNRSKDIIQPCPIIKYMSQLKSVINVKISCPIYLIKSSPSSHSLLLFSLWQISACVWGDGLTPLLCDLYVFQCHSPKSSHPLPLPQSPKDCSIHQCLFCCLVYGVIVTIFLNSIYMHQYPVLVFFFLAYFTLYNMLQFHPPRQN